MILLSIVYIFVAALEIGDNGNYSQNHNFLKLLYKVDNYLKIIKIHSVVELCLLYIEIETASLFGAVEWGIMIIKVGYSLDDEWFHKFYNAVSNRGLS